VTLGQREDLRSVPLVTIDGADARDFDDAVWAEPDAARPGGWHALVAIADVAWYVRPGDALDEAALERGNSVYFPDRVVPMLPEELSNELCSLKPAVERACIAVHLYIDSEGRLERHRFVRGLMRSAARLTYEAAQAAIDGNPDAQSRPLVEPVLRPLYGVYRALDAARLKRGSLELDLPERQIFLDPAGRVARIEPRQRLDSHKLIEELMICANVAAAETLERLKQPCMYRVHDVPDPAKLAALREFLDHLGLPGLKLAKGQAIRPRHFNDILRKAAGTPFAPLVHQLVLRSQAQAVYSPNNLGHFGLGLRRYAHFTSPIRRYSDLLVHRALVAGQNFGAGALPPTDPKAFAATGEHVSMTERRAAAAERSASDRYLVAFLAERVGASFPGRINGVTRAGLFVTLSETGADGLVPMRSLPGDYYEHDEAHHRLIGRRTRRSFTLGDPVTVRLAEANSVTGSLLFTMTEAGDDAAAPPRPGRPRFTRGRR
jgi:ribonuclease R